MRSFELITFDLGNVLSLVDESGAIEELSVLSGRTPAEVFEVAYAPHRKAVLESGRQTWEEFAHDVGAGLQLDIDLDHFRTIFESVLTPNQEMAPLVFELSTRYRLALCSNTSAPHWELERARLPFAKLLDPAIVSYEAGVMKPDPSIYRLVASSAGVPIQRTLFVDDMAANVAGARVAGMKALHFTGAVQLRADLQALGVL